MPLDDDLWERVVFIGGKVSKVTCPDCDYSGREPNLDPHRFTAIDCPECGATILTEGEKSSLRQADKL